MTVDKSVFIVDDDEGFVDTIAMFLRRKGYRVSVAKSLGEAFKTIVKIKPDLAVVDLLLDDGEGTEIISRIKELYPSTYTILLSGHREDEASKKAKEAGADEFAPKPFTASQLKALIEKVFGG